MSDILNDARIKKLRAAALAIQQSVNSGPDTQHRLSFIEAFSAALAANPDIQNWLHEQIDDGAIVPSNANGGGMSGFSQATPTAKGGLSRRSRPPRVRARFSKHKQHLSGLAGGTQS